MRYKTFENLEEAKKQKIINAGFTVFARNGYAKASVDKIIREADISKGSLFYYFSSKKNFFLFLYEYSTEQLESLIDHPGPDGKPSYLVYADFFERLNAIQELKLKYSAGYPNMYSFMKKAVFDDAPGIKAEISKINERYTAERAMAFFQGIDYHKFKDGIDPMMVVQLVSWCSEGCANQVLMKEGLKNPSAEPAPDFNEIIRLYQSYIELFRKNFYKEEYL